MRQIHCRFLIILFALLQCMAPLMHAHAHAVGHSGIHLPGLSDVHEHGHANVLWADAQDVDHEMAVDLALTLQPGSNADHGMAGPVFRLPGTPFARIGLSPPPTEPLVLPGPPPHLIPFPGAPPAA